ncbi:MAG: NAD-dependent epimerase/dehydratase family protein [Gammaproteobacteria bacterium]|nr:NAD-dependent epimerase/dehydratase family protein [Gammaproteobacteria bacterium]
MKVLITGGAGFIGSNLADYHLEKGDEVYAIDNFLGSPHSNIKHLLTHKNFHFTNADLRECPELGDILGNVQRVYHLAALLGMFRILAHPVDTLDDNIKTTEVLLRTAKKQKNKPVLLIASSSEVYGNQIGPLYEDRPLILEGTIKNHSNYPISKICDEGMALAYYHEHKVPTVVLRIFNTIGKRQSGRYGMVVPRFIKQAVSGEPITLFGTGEQSRSFCDVRDTVCILDRLADNKKAIGEIVNIGNDAVISIHDLAVKVKTLAGSSSKIIYQPYDDVYHGGYVDIQQRQIDSKKLLSLTDYSYRYTLDDTINYLIAQARHER